MQLELAIVQTCTPTGAQVRLLQEEQPPFTERSRPSLDTRYSLQIMRYEVEIRPGDLVVVDTSADPPCTAFCFARSQVERVESRVHTDRDTHPQTPIEGLADTLKSGDWVFASMGQIYDRCVDGLPADVDRLWDKARPWVEPQVQSSTPAPEPEPAQAVRTSGPPRIEYLTAETERGRQALQVVMDRSYRADYGGLPPEWTLVRLVDGVPVSCIVVHPNLELAMGCASDQSTGIPYAFVNDVATRTDRRREGHFRALMEHTYQLLRQNGYSVILLHGRYPLYRPLGFDVFTHHCGIFVTPEQIERVLGPSVEGKNHDGLQFEDHRGIQPDLLVVTRVKSSSLSECAASLRAAAALAREKDRARILFEHPPAPCGKRYTIHASPETTFTALARTCGAEVRLQGADPESSAIPDADWIKVLDAAALVGQALDCRSEAPPLGRPAVHGGEEEKRGALPKATVALDTDAGAVTIMSREDRVVAHEGIAPGERALHWPSSALAQLVTGYRSAQTLAMLHDLELPPEAQALLSALFPSCWRFSRNESWTLGG